MLSWDHIKLSDLTILGSLGALVRSSCDNLAISLAAEMMEAVASSVPPLALPLALPSCWAGDLSSLVSSGGWGPRSAPPKK